MKLIALKEMRYDTRRLLPGDEFEATTPHGRLLIAARKAADPLKRDIGKVASPSPAVLKKASEVVDSTPPATPPSNSEGSVTPASLHPAGETLDTLRAEYTALVGKKPFNGWDVETLRTKIDAFRANG